MKAHTIFDTDGYFRITEPGREHETPILATVHRASPEAVAEVLRQPEDTGDGRSPWVWLRLVDGTLILGVFPQGETYMAMEMDASYPGDED